VKHIFLKKKIIFSDDASKTEANAVRITALDLAAAVSSARYSKKNGPHLVSQENLYLLDNGISHVYHKASN
jgi:hypothetical protein